MGTAGYFPPGVKKPGLEADHSPPSTMQRLKIVDVQSPIIIHDAVLN
jgi:hypothetical protein